VKQNSFSEHALGIEEKIKGYVLEDIVFNFSLFTIEYAVLCCVV